MLSGERAEPRVVNVPVTPSDEQGKPSGLVKFFANRVEPHPFDVRGRARVSGISAGCGLGPKLAPAAHPARVDTARADPRPCPSRPSPPSLAQSVSATITPPAEW